MLKQLTTRGYVKKYINYHKLVNKFQKNVFRQAQAMNVINKHFDYLKLYIIKLYNLQMTEKYQRKFTKPGSISEALKCIICSQVYTNPVRLFCSHTYCKHCIDKWRKSSNNGCPNCRVPIDLKNMGSDLIAKNIIDELEVFCIIQECDWRGRNDLLMEHYENECIMRDLTNKTTKQFGKKNKQKSKLQQTILDASLEQKINKNVAKGSLQARLLTKDMHLQEAAINSKNISSKVQPQKGSTFDFLQQLFD